MKRITTLAVSLIVVSLANAPAVRSSYAGRCPLPTSVRDGGSIDAVIRAAERLIPRAFNASTPGNSWARYPVINSAMSLTPLLGTPGATTLRTIGARRCGQTTAARSWAVTVYFPGLKVAEPPTTLFLTLTDHGWRLW